MPRKAFTIIEVIMSISILGILFTALQFSGLALTEKAKGTAENLDIGAYEIATYTVISDEVPILDINSFCEKLNKQLDPAYALKVEADYLISLDKKSNSGEHYILRPSIDFSACAIYLNNEVKKEVRLQ